MTYPHDTSTILWFHWIETLIGAALAVGMFGGVVSLWLLPIAVSLVGAVGLSMLSGWNLRAQNAVSLAAVTNGSGVSQSFRQSEN